MAKTPVPEAVPCSVTKATELKKELQRLVMAILEEEDCGLEVADEAMRVLSAMRVLKFKKTSDSLKVVDERTRIPEEFRCPISKELMVDPVVLATGQTYDRPFIQRWLNEGKRTCPQTKQVLAHTILTPNQLVREMISQWCKEHQIELPKCVPTLDEEVVTKADRGHLKSLLQKMSSSLSDQKDAAKELRLLTKTIPSFRALFSDSPNAIPQLLNPLSSGSVNAHPDLQEDVITTILNLSIYDSNKRLVAEYPAAIPLLIESLKFGTIETRSNAAAALFSLSALDSNKLSIGKSGALKPLIDLLDEGHPLAMKDAASAIFNLCIEVENRSRVVWDGAVSVILKKVIDNVLVDELLSILAMLASHHRAVEELCELDAVPALLRIIRESASERNKENCVAILHTICTNDHTKWRELREDEKANGTISRVAETGTSRAKRKASSILERLNRSSSHTH
ncbi:hypothetical protein Tsubulata_000815 [Turnera subulata]|uniref:RING-type E3 ubiquitin transferase n=1 Tax=Turnera subulata TaxID=218843 RepID=A0A9Q0JKM3_9ROSI|nr:hypothetical protein Tsubulata_000815 [Turnera subulata]